MDFPVYEPGLDRRVSELLDAVLYASAGLVVVLDREGRIVRFNRRCVELTGFTAAEVVGRQLWDMLIPPDQRTEVIEVFRDLRDNSLPSTFENDWLTRTGERVRIVWSNSAVSDEDGRVAYVVGTGLDVGEHRRIESALQESQALRQAEAARYAAETRLASVVSIAADAIITCDAEQRITFFNEGAEQIFRYSARQVTGWPLDVLLPARLRAVHHGHVQRFTALPSAARRMGERREIVGLRSDGEEFPAEASIARGEIAGEAVLTVVLRDASERKRADERFRLLADAGRELASSLDYDATLRNVARLSVRSLADYCVVDMVEEGRFERLTVAHRNPEHAPIASALENLPLDRSRPHLLSSVLATGEPVLVEEVSPVDLESVAQDEAHLRLLRALNLRSMIAVPLAARGNVLGAILFLAGTSAPRYNESDLAVAEKLARLAALALDNARLYGTAQRAIAARDEVVAILSHDLRNPVHAVGLVADALENHLLPGEASAKGRAYLDMLHRVMDEMNRLIQNLLDVARIEAGRLRLDREHQALPPLLNEMLETLRLIAAEKSIRLEASADDDLPPVYADRSRVAQIVQNLVGNALKFTATGGHVVVRAENADGAVRISVIDTGSGIAPEQRARLFDRFWQARQTGRAGAGLGLTIVKGIVEAHGGTIWVESVEGRGSTFHFTLPTASQTTPSPP